MCCVKCSIREKNESFHLTSSKFDSTKGGGFYPYSSAASSSPSSGGGLGFLRRYRSRPDVRVLSSGFYMIVLTKCFHCSSVCSI